MEKSETKVDGKMEFMAIARELMPQGKPNFLTVVDFTMIRVLKTSEQSGNLHKVIFLLVKDFCNSMNVVRNMNEDGMIEAAGMLLDECDNFRLEDYAMMFQMAKRGELFDIHDRIDLQVITAILDEYWIRRKEAGEKAIVEESRHLDSLGNTYRLEETVSITDSKLMNMANGMSAALGALKDVVATRIGDREERERLRSIEKEETEKVKQQLKERGYNS